MITVWPCCPPSTWGMPYASFSVIQCEVTTQNFPLKYIKKEEWNRDEYFFWSTLGKGRKKNIYYLWVEKLLVAFPLVTVNSFIISFLVTIIVILLIICIIIIIIIINLEYSLNCTSNQVNLNICSNLLHTVCTVYCMVSFHIVFFTQT